MKAIINATIFCPTQGLVENGTILFDEGKIRAIGANLSVPDGAEIIDVQNKFVLPGFIDAHTHQGLFDGTIGWAGEDGNEMVADPITPEMRGIDSFNPADPALKDLYHGGITCLNTGPGSGNVISGQSFVIKLKGGKIVDEMILLAPSGLKVALGENPKKVHGQMGKRVPSTRMGVAALLRKAFIDAKNYIREWDNFEERLMEATEKEKVIFGLPKRDMKMEMMVMVLRKEIPLHAHAHRADDIATIISGSLKNSMQD